MTREEKLNEIRTRCIELIHWDYKKWLQKEKKIFWCRWIKIKWKEYIYKSHPIINVWGCEYNPTKQNYGGDIRIHIIWLPINLSRLLSALINLYKDNSDFWFIEKVIVRRQWLYFKKVCNWKLIKENWQEAILEDQEEETINVLFDLLKKLNND
jgi:hypothetical protein